MRLAPHVYLNLHLKRLMGRQVFLQTLNDAWTTLVVAGALQAIRQQFFGQVTYCCWLGGTCYESQFLRNNKRFFNRRRTAGTHH